MIKLRLRQRKLIDDLSSLLLPALLDTFFGLKAAGRELLRFNPV